MEGVAEPASGQDGLFNPCRDIPDSAIEGIGLDPATEQIDIGGVEQPGWKICSWDGPWYLVALYSNVYSIDELRANPDYSAFEDVAIGSRRGVQYRRTNDPEFDDCFVAVDVEQGSVWLKVSRKGLRPKEEPVCKLVMDFSKKLESYLPH